MPAQKNDSYSNVPVKSRFFGLAPAHALPPTKQTEADTLEQEVPRDQQQWRPRQQQQQLCGHVVVVGELFVRGVLPQLRRGAGGGYAIDGRGVVVG